MKKSLCSIVFAFIIIFAMCVPAMAAEVPNVTANEAVTNISYSSVPDDIAVIEFDSYEEHANYVNELEKEAISKGATIISASVIRSGTSNSCELYLNWAGDEMYSAFRYKTITVKSTSLLFPETYATFGNGSTYTTKNVTAAIAGSVKIGNLTIDSGVTKVKVNSSGLQGYNMKSASWLSAVEFTGTVTIN